MRKLAGSVPGRRGVAVAAARCRSEEALSNARARLAGPLGCFLRRWRFVAPPARRGVWRGCAVSLTARRWMPQDEQATAVGSAGRPLRGGRQGGCGAAVPAMCAAAAGRVRTPGSGRRGARASDRDQTLAQDLIAARPVILCLAAGTSPAGICARWRRLPGRSCCCGIGASFTLPVDEILPAGRPCRGEGPPQAASRTGRPTSPGSHRVPARGRERRVTETFTLITTRLTLRRRRPRNWRSCIQADGDREPRWAR